MKASKTREIIDFVQFWANILRYWWKRPTTTLNFPIFFHANNRQHHHQVLHQKEFAKSLHRSKRYEQLKFFLSLDERKEKSARGSRVTVFWSGATSYGLIYGTMHRYYWHNTSIKDFGTLTKLLFYRLTDRTHRAQELAPLFIKAAQEI